MHECESLATGAGRKRDLCHHLRSHQRPPTQNSAVESSRCRVVRRGADGCDRCNDAGAGVSRNQLRYAGIAAGYDAHLGLSLSRAFFRMGRGTAAEFLANSCAPSALRHAHFGNSLCPAGERHDLPDAHTACGGRYPAREAAAASVSHRAGDERKHRQCGHAGGQSAKHDHWTFLAYFVSGIFAVAPAGGGYWTGDQFLHFALWLSKMLRQTAIDRSEHMVPKLERGLFALVCVVFVSIFAGFLAGLNLAWTAMAGAALVMVLARRDTHNVLKLVDWHLLLFFAALFIVVDGLSDTGLPDAIYSRLQPIFGLSPPAQAWNLTWFSVLGSNVFSNVPFVFVAGNWIARFTEPALMWKVLALATTFAGNLTIIGSVANMIVVESARDHIQVGFWDYARFGIPITILTTAAGVVVLLVLR